MPVALGKILFVTFISIAIILLIIVLFIFIPYKYTFIATYNDRDLIVKLEVFIFRFEFNLKLTIPPKYTLRLFNRILVDSDIKKDVKEKKKSDGESVAKTGFLKNKKIEEVVSESKTAIKELFLDAKRYDKKFFSDGKIVEKKSVGKLLYNLLPYKQVKVAKLIIDEAAPYIYKIRPKTYDVNINYGFDDAGKTGKLLAVAAPLYALFGDSLDITPNFKRKEFNGSILISGRLIVIYPLIPMVKLLFNKDFREFLRGGKKKKKKKKKK